MNELTKYNDTLANLNSGMVTLNANSLALSPDATKDDVKAVFSALSVCQTSSLFWAGDLLNETESRYGETYSNALTLTNYDYATLRVAKSVCKKLPPAKRRSVSFTHHKEALVESGQDAEIASRYLVIAEEAQLTVSQMRKEMRLALNPPAPSDGSRLVEDEDERSRLEVLNAIESLKRYLLTTEPDAIAFIKQHLSPRLRELLALAEAVR